jgi:hypothetical protein
LGRNDNMVNEAQPNNDYVPRRRVIQERSVTVNRNVRSPYRSSSSYRSSQRSPVRRSGGSGGSSHRHSR